EPDRRQILHDNASWLREQLRGVGCNTGNCASQIIPIYIGAPDRTMELAAHLQSAGYLVPGIRPPSVPAGESLLRISLCYGHARESLEAFVELLREFT
ncbi:MAG: aminotransferase class I/II-fold pyridoxal phosphate-dependent enzyme, partial [Planctomycetales bacterium]|nr:aminotransferase class I/II-fold pyridoxal phosphate-dependent enzyme [Planctomycetales bacterium]